MIKLGYSNVNESALDDLVSQINKAGSWALYNKIREKSGSAEYKKVVFNEKSKWVVELSDKVNFNGKESSVVSIIVDQDDTVIKLSDKREISLMELIHNDEGRLVTSTFEINKGKYTEIKKEDSARDNLSGWWLELSNEPNDKNPKIVTAKNKYDASNKRDTYKSKYKYVYVFDDGDYIDPSEL